MAKDHDVKLQERAHELERKLAEFRDNNRTLHSQLRQYEGVDPVEYHALKEKLAALGDIENPEVLKKSAEKLREVEQKLVAATEQLAAEKAAHGQTKTSHAIATAFLRGGGRPDAIDYATTKASGLFTVAEDGTITSTTPSPSKPGQMLSLDEFIGTLRETAAYVFQPSRGGGAVGHQGPGPAVPAVRTITSDPGEVGRNLEGIAAGTVRVS